MYFIDKIWTGIDTTDREGNGTPLQYFGHLIRRVDSLEKTDVGKDWGQEEKGTPEDEMAGWHY